MMKSKEFEIRVGGEKGEVVGTIQVPCTMQAYMAKLLAPFKTEYEGKVISAICHETGEILSTLPSEFRGTREWTPAEVHQVCNKYNLFTQGGNDQYNKMFEMVEDGASFEELMAVMWVCSEIEEYPDLLEIFYSEFVLRY